MLYCYGLDAGTGAGWYEVSNKVRRNSGPDGGYVMQHAGWATMWSWSGGVEVLSPLVYSPNNAAAACVSTRANDQAACTSYL